eukprot:COSAG02_NODE_7911_length_2794_cov_3.712430_1_plen_160_part_00
MGNFFSNEEEIHPVIIKKPNGEQVEVQCDLNKHGSDLARAVATRLSLPLGSFSLVYAGNQIQDQAEGETLFEQGFVYTGCPVLSIGPRCRCYPNGCSPWICQGDGERRTVVQCFGPRSGAMQSATLGYSAMQPPLCCGPSERINTRECFIAVLCSFSLR